MPAPPRGFQNPKNFSNDVKDAIEEFFHRYNITTADGFAKAGADSLFLKFKEQEFLLRPYLDGTKPPDRVASNGTGPSTLELAMWGLMTEEQQAALSSINAEAVRQLNAPSTSTDQSDQLRQLKWEGYMYRTTTLSARVAALRDGDDLIEGLIPRRSLIMAVGDSGLGKSPLIYQQAFSVACGVPFLGRPTRQGRVLVVDYENGQGQVLGMLQSFANYYRVPMPDKNLFLVNANDVPPEWETTGHTLFDLINDLKPDLTMIDSFGSAFPEVESKNELVTRKFKQLREIICATGTTAQLVHNLRKASDHPDYTPERLEDGRLARWFLQVRGPRALINGSDVRLGIERPALHPQACLALRGFRRVTGELPLVYLRRALDPTDLKTPLAYEEIQGAGLLFNSDQQKAFDTLPAEFSFTEAKRAFGKAPQATTDWLGKCIQIGILQQPEARGMYCKTSNGEYGRTRRTT